MKLDCSLTNSRTTSTEVKLTTPDTPEILHQILNILPQVGTAKMIDGNDEYESISNDDHETATTKENEVKYSDCMFENDSPPEQPSEDPEEKREDTRAVLKMRVKRKRKHSDCSIRDSEEGQMFEKACNQGFTSDDDLRKQRRRERNKVAATKCRNKKKERTTRLIAEGEVLDIQNECLKDELMRLELETKHLTTMLAQHEPSCVKNIKKEETTTDNEKYENKSCLFDANKNNNNVHFNNNNNNTVYSDCKYKVKEEDRFYENDNSVSDASPAGDDIHLDDFVESIGSVVEDYSEQQTHDWYHPHYWHQRNHYPLSQQGGYVPHQGYSWPQAEHECMTL